MNQHDQGNLFPAPKPNPPPKMLSTTNLWHESAQPTVVSKFFTQPTTDVVSAELTLVQRKIEYCSTEPLGLS